MVIGALSLVPLYAIKRYGISEINSGTLLVTQGVASVIMSTIMSINLRRTGYRLPLYIGCSLTALGVFLLTFHPPSFVLPFWWLSLSTLLIGFGFGFMSPAARNAGIHLEPHQSANIAAIRSLGLQLGNIYFGSNCNHHYYYFLQRNFCPINGMSCPFCDTFHATSHYF